MTATKSRAAAPRPDALWRCEGFAAESPEGRIGTVEDVIRVPGLSRPAGLAVRCGLFGRRIVLIPAGEVAEIDPERRRVLLRSSPHLAGSVPASAWRAQPD